VCGTDGLQARGFGLGLVMGHDTKSGECVWALVSEFLRPRGPPTEVPATAGFCLLTHWIPAPDIRGHNTRQCAATAQHTNAFSSGVCVVKSPRDFQ
jgi:hypothetical protein